MNRQPKPIWRHVPETDSHADLDKQMKNAAANLEFEETARLRDEIKRLEAVDLGLARPGAPPKAAAKFGAPQGKSRRVMKRKGRRK